jgi:hypothetical protein
MVKIKKSRKKQNLKANKNDNAKSNQISDYNLWMKKAWHFIWEDDSVWSWLANIVIAYILIKFIVYPVLGFMLSTTHPIVAVVSGSMEHKTVPLCYQRDFLNQCVKENPSLFEACGNIVPYKKRLSFNEFWDLCGKWYVQHNISKKEFEEFPYRNGFNTGDIMILYGKPLNKIKVGDILVFWGNRADPIIHRIIYKNDHFFQTKGDHNSDSGSFEQNIPNDKVVGYKKYNRGSIAIFRIPYLGYIKIWFVKLIMLILNLF